MIQGSDEWLQARIGKVTASRVHDIIATTRSGGYTAGRKNYMAELVWERLTGELTEHYVSPAMILGSEKEPKARFAYTLERGVEVEQVGFITHPTIPNAGASPDGLVGDGLIEIKVPNGVAGIRGTRGRANSNSYIVLLDGTLIFVHVPPGGQPVPYTLVAPPPVYFSPLEGIKPAPQDLILDTDSGFQGTTPEPPVEAGGGVQEEPVVFVEPDKGETPVSPTMPVDQ